jgi:hypothetical protein
MNLVEFAATLQLLLVSLSGYAVMNLDAADCRDFSL